MKTKHILLAAVLAATSAIQAATAEHKLPAPLPEFKTPEQLAKWRKEVTAKAQVADTQVQFAALAFYTGKPYVEESGAYAFKYRHYDPELSRWTTIDPSGFPDGLNNQIYCNRPLTGFDPDGMAWNTADFLWHFYFGGGNTVSLSQIGYLSGVLSVANASSTGGVYRFQAQVNKTAGGIKKPYSGSFSDTFSNSYDFGSVKFELGDGVLSGSYTGTMTSTPFTSMPGGTYSYSGPADITYSDTFTDPSGIIQAVYGSSTSPSAPSWLAAAANLGGTAFSITESWSQTFSGSGVYE